MKRNEKAMGVSSEGAVRSSLDVDLNYRKKDLQARKEDCPGLERCGRKWAVLDKRSEKKKFGGGGKKGDNQKN